MNRRAVLFAMVAALILSLSACGKKGPPVPPSSPVSPEKASNYMDSGNKGPAPAAVPVDFPDRQEN